jgi:hypothetical protein
MSARAESYANEFEQLSQQFIAQVEGCTPRQMQARCEGEQCTVAALASHVAEGHPAIVEWIELVATGQPLPPVTMDDLNAMNEEQFARDASRPKDEILVALRENGAATVSFLRGLDDAGLDRSQHLDLMGSDVSADWLIQNVLIPELVHHPASIRAACEQVSTS